VGATVWRGGADRRTSVTFERDQPEVENFALPSILLRRSNQLERAEALDG